MTDTPDYIPVTDEQRRESRKRLARTRELALEAMQEPPVHIANPGKFTEPMGILADGTHEPPPTPEKLAHLEAPASDRSRFTEPLGLDESGNLQPPLTPEEAAHNEEVRRKGREEARLAREQVNRDESR